MKAIVLLPFALALSVASWAQSPGDHAHHPHAAPAAVSKAPPAEREAVEFPPRLKEEMLANMREHLQSIQEITALLADKKFDAAADVAETRLGMSSLERHGAHEVGKYMPLGMRQIGSGMHRGASQFAVVAQEAGATGDTGAALRALASVQASCVACHAAYRLK